MVRDKPKGGPEKTRDVRQVGGDIPFGGGGYETILNFLELRRAL